MVPFPDIKKHREVKKYVLERDRSNLLEKPPQCSNEMYVLNNYIL